MKHDPEALLAAVRELDAKTKNLEYAIRALNTVDDGCDHKDAIDILETAKTQLKADFRTPKAKKVKRQAVGAAIEADWGHIQSMDSAELGVWAQGKGLNVGSVRKAFARKTKASATT